MDYDSVEQIMLSELMPEISLTGEFLCNGYVPYDLVIYRGDELIDWFRLRDNSDLREVVTDIYYSEFCVNLQQERNLFVLSLQYCIVTVI